MAIWRLFYSTIRSISSIVADALFPLSRVEEELALIVPEDVRSILPPAPPYDNSVVPLPEVRSLFAYKDERVSRMVWCIKYKKSAHAVKLGGYALFQELHAARLGLPAKCILVPIPITSKRRRERGYNQCELLVDEISRLDTGSGTEKRFIIKKDLLTRTQNSTSQKTKDRQARLEGAKGLFEISIDKQIGVGTSVPIVVIDDVITTGSTMKEAMDVLRTAGFAEVRGLSLAH